MKHIWIFSFLLLGSVIPKPPHKGYSLPDTRFVVFSDPHYYDPSLGISGKAFQDYLDQDRKLLRESRELLEEAVALVKNTPATFVIIPGDLTKDGTLISHSRFAEKMKELEKAGKEVYVVPGNHDIANGEAYAFSGDSTTLQNNVDPGKFLDIYHDFGYGEALAKDTASLSYVAEPAPGTWLVGLDACIYENNRAHDHPDTGGRLREATLAWLEGVAAEAERREKLLMAFMHHGALEHYRGQDRFFGEYIIDQHKKVSKKLASLGIKIIFTGHYHAQDITLERWNENTYLADVETGSLVTWPCPVREGYIRGDTLSLRTHNITSIPSYEDDFADYGRQYVYDGVAGIAEKTLINMKLRYGDAENLSSQIGDAFLAHYAGDEVPVEKPLDMKGVNLKGRIIISFRKKLVKGLYHDLPPADNELKLLLSTGEILDEGF